jgi:hypothetical protein
MLTIDGSKIKLAEFTCKKGTVPPQEIDLSLYLGQTVRIYLDNVLKMVVNPQYDCYWHLAEMVLPPPQNREITAGTKEIEERNTLYVSRGAGDSDAIDDPGGIVETIGFEWQHYRKDIEYRVASVSGGLAIAWLTDRRPQEGEQYPLTIRTAREVPDTVSEPVPLDLSRVEITTYTLPE